MSCIEFFGCTSSGKSTLIRQCLQASRAAGVDAMLGENFLLDQFRLGRVGNSKIRAVLVNLFSLPVALTHWWKYRHFFRYAFQKITQVQNPLRQKVYLGRNILKTIGIFEIAHSQKDKGKVIFLDEGPLNSSSALFVNDGITPPQEELSEFIRVVPFPDAVVYLREHEDVLIQRTLDRGHKRIRNNKPGEVVQFIQSAISMFDRLSQMPAVQSKCVIVEDHKVTSPRNGTDDPLETFILNILRTCLKNTSVDAGKVSQPFALDQLPSRIDIGNIIKDKS